MNLGRVNGSKNFDVNAARKNLWMSEHDLIDLESKGVSLVYILIHTKQMSKLIKRQCSSIKKTMSISPN